MISGEDYFEEFRMLYSKDVHKLNEVIDKGYELIQKIAELRDSYKGKDLLPLYPINSDFENLTNLIRLIENEVHMFGTPGTFSKRYVDLSEEDMQLLRDRADDELVEMYSDWIEEGLI